MRISLRPAANDDFEFCRLAHHAAYRDVVVRQFGPWNDLVQDQFFTDGWKADTHQILLADRDCCGYLSIDHQSDHVFIREIVILPEFQRKGIGTALLRDILDNGKHSSVRLQVLKANRARQLYLRLGFRETGTTETHCQMEWKPLPGC